MLLKEENHKITTYQVFIEPKGDQFKDKDGKFKNSKEGWEARFFAIIRKRGGDRI